MQNNHYQKYKKYKKKYLDLKSRKSSLKEKVQSESSLFDSYVPDYESDTLCTDGDCDEFDEYNDYNDTDSSQLLSLSRMSTSDGDAFYKVVDISMVNKDELSTDLEPNSYKILKIDTVDNFDKFTSKYGFLKDDSVKINWEDVSNDFKGVYLAQNTDLMRERFEKALFKDIMYNSWWEDDWIDGDVMVFNDISM